MARVSNSCFEFTPEELSHAGYASMVSVLTVAIIACAIAVILIIVLKPYHTKFLNHLAFYLMVAAGRYSMILLS